MTKAWYSAHCVPGPAVALLCAQPSIHVCAGRQHCTSAANASTLVNSWRDAEAAPFTAVAGDDLLTTGQHRAPGEARRERERQRNEAADEGVIGGSRQRRSAQIQRYSFFIEEEEEEEESEEDAGARDDDSEEEGGRRRGRGGAGGRRRDARRQPQETIASRRPKRQRHTRSVDPDMLDTDAALNAAFGDGVGWAAAPTGAVDAPRTRSRAVPLASVPAAAASMAVTAATLPAAALPAAAAPPALPLPLPAAPPGIGLTAPRPTAPRRAAGVSAAVLRAARTPPPATPAAGPTSAAHAEAVDAVPGQLAGAAPFSPALAAVHMHGSGTAAAPACTAAAAADPAPQPQPPAVAGASAEARPAAHVVPPPLADAAAALPCLPQQVVQAAATKTALPCPPLPGVPVGAAGSALTTAGSPAALPTASTAPSCLAANSVRKPAAVVEPLAGTQQGNGVAMTQPAVQASLPAAAAFLAAEQPATAGVESGTADGEQPKAASQATWAAAAPAPAAAAASTVGASQAVGPAQPVPASAVASVTTMQAAPLQAPPTAPPLATAFSGHSAVKAEPTAVQRASMAPTLSAEAVATALWTAAGAGAAAATGPAVPGVVPGPAAAGGSGRTPVDVLYGCAKCRYLRGGCNTCRCGLAASASGSPAQPSRGPSWALPMLCARTPRSTCAGDVRGAACGRSWTAPKPLLLACACSAADPGSRPSRGRACVGSQPRVITRLVGLIGMACRESSCCLPAPRWFCVGVAAPRLARPGRAVKHALSTRPVHRHRGGPRLPPHARGVQGPHCLHLQDQTPGGEVRAGPHHPSAR